MASAFDRLTPEEKEEFRDQCSDGLGEEVPDSFLKAVADHDEHVIWEGMEWGFSDTVVRDAMCRSVTEVLLGQGRPTHGDRAELEEFEARLEEAYREWVKDHEDSV